MFEGSDGIFLEVDIWSKLRSYFTNLAKILEWRGFSTYPSLPLLVVSYFQHLETLWPRMVESMMNLKPKHPGILSHVWAWTFLRVQCRFINPHSWRTEMRHDPWGMGEFRASTPTICQDTRHTGNDYPHIYVDTWVANINSGAPHSANFQKHWATNEG